MYQAVIRIVATLSSRVEPFVETVYPAVSVFDAVPCEVSQEFVPLFNLIDALVQLGTFIAVAAAVLSLTYAGLIYIFGTKIQIERANRRVRSVLIGVVIVLMANSVIVFLAVNLGVCNRGV